MRRPLGSLPIPTAEFILKVTPQNSGSKHLVLGTEDIPPGGVIPHISILSKTKSCWSRRAVVRQNSVQPRNQQLARFPRLAHLL